MKRFVLALAFVAVASCAFAGSLTLLGAGVPTAPVSFQGIVDVAPSPTGCWGLTACSAATRGTKAIKLCDPTSAVCADWFTDAATGNLVATTNPLNGTDCTAVTTCRIDTWYCQTGTGCADLVQATPTFQLTLTPNCINTTKYCGSDNAGKTAVGTFGSSVSLPYTLVGVGRRNAGFTTFMSLYGDASSNAEIGWANSANTALFYQSITQGSVSDSTFHVIQGIGVSGTNNSTLNVDGTATAGTQILTLGTSRGIGKGLSILNGDVTIVAEWPSALTPTQQTNVCHVIRSYYATPGSC